MQNATQPSTAQLHTQSARVTVPLSTDWQFHKGALATVLAAPDAFSGWETVALPHTWNATDGQDGGTPYFRGDGWYHRAITIPPTLHGKELYLRFRGSNRRTEVFLNGQRSGGHVGGTQAFVIDATPFLHSGENQLVVHVDNKPDPDSPPLQADFTFFGGIYRPVELLALNPLHISMADYGSPGVFITTPHVSDTVATVHVRTILQNDAEQTASGVLLVQVCDATGREVGSQRTPFTLPSEGGGELSTDLTMPHPHRWDGRNDPYLYSVKTSLLSGRRAETSTDSVTQPLGIRTYSIDPDRGFILNGRPYALHGVDRHQERQDKGWAISQDDEREDMALIKEMGCTSLRLAHYQQSDFFYNLCDQAGMVVWAEIPVVDRLGSSKAFTDNARQQYTELIRQNYNHPSICFWSAGNEVDESGGNFNKAGPPVYDWFRKMGELGKAEDPTRLTASTFRERFFPPPDVTDVFGLNIYLGWYNNTFSEIEDYIRRHDANGARGKWAVTEYGAGASIYFHSEKPVRMDHTEEYQCLYHEHNWNVLKHHPEIWGKYVWNMFDFASDGRFEGDRAGINDKGLITQDHKVKKDAFFFYKANWSSEPTLHITAKRFTVRGVPNIPIKVYSNAAHVTLQINGESLGEKTNENATFVWENVTLRPGPNSVQAQATFHDGTALTDTTSFTYTPGAPTEIYDAQSAEMKKALERGPPRVDFPHKPPATRPAPATKQ